MRLQDYPFDLLDQRGEFFVAPVGTRPPIPETDGALWLNEWERPWESLFGPDAMPVKVEPPRYARGLFSEPHEYRVILPEPLPEAHAYLGKLHQSPIPGEPDYHLSFSLGWQGNGIRAAWFHLRPSPQPADRGLEGRAFLALGHAPILSSFRLWAASSAVVHGRRS